VGLGKGDAIVVLAQARKTQTTSRIQDHDVDALDISVLQVALHGDGWIRDAAILPPVEAIANANTLALTKLLRQALAVHGLLIHHVPVGVDDDHTVAHSVLPR